MEITKEAVKTAGLILLGIALVGSVSFDVYDTGEELVCRTGDGWTILEDYGVYKHVVCEYKTKEWVYADCSSFRATATKERYGCNQVAVVKQTPDDKTTQKPLDPIFVPSGSTVCIPGIKVYSCNPIGCVQTC